MPTEPRPAPASTHTVVDLGSVGRNDIALAGGKGANLGELIRAGFPVPPGFIVTTDAYCSALTAAGLSTQDPALATSDGAALRAAITALELPKHIATAITDAYTRLGGTVAVRSSATAEDLPGAAFAGQQDTYLGVVGAEAVLDAVRACWASLWNERAIAYRRRLSIDPAEVAIAVVVQSLIPADVAGVLFTADPVTGARDHLVIDASAGLGEVVVSGLVTPDHYVIDRTGRTLEFSPGKREVIISSDGHGGITRTEVVMQAEGAPAAAQASNPAAAAAGAPAAGAPVAGAPVGSSTDNPASKPLLSHAALAELASLGTAISKLFDGPQDIEWAIAGNQLALLQARPMTALPIPQKLNRVQRLIGSVFSDYFSVRPYPLDMDTWIPYGPLGMMGRVMASVGIRSNFDRILPEEDGVVVQFVPPMPSPTGHVVKAPFSVLSRARRYDPARWTTDPRYADFERRLQELTRSDPAAASWPELVASVHAALDLVDPITTLRTQYLPGMGVAIIRLRLALTRVRRTRLMADLIIGAPTITARGNERLSELAETVRADATLRSLLTERDARAALERVTSDPAFAGFTSAFAEYLQQYGHRETISPVLASSPTWSEAPETVLGLIALLASDDSERAAATRAADAEEALFAHRRLQSPKARERMQWRIRAARAGIGFREDSHDAFMRTLPPLRRALLEIGVRLRGAGVLSEPADVFHLRLGEIETVGEVATLTPTQAAELCAVATARMLKREQLASVRMVDYAAIFGRPRRDENALVSGTPACAGRATGTVRVISGPDEFGSLRPGEILVCPYTNPAWTPLFQSAAAVVVDTGGIGSHAAIVAREIGIPAIMGTGEGTRTLRTGQRVTVDGGAGVVTAA
ncbi:PEP/pyruvate-binding domain-containing protein [Rathayibacter soli]|uniref:PEP/pyruvate-binding domain-containing protein n=1 Tax=Rathayibacter soli TaxID=3144168 RepID=UPI0027E4C48E|nr:PEP/pyruvate-binding domain-containing protein [Glaciibacter superstes]